MRRLALAILDVLLFAAVLAAAFILMAGCAKAPQPAPKAAPLPLPPAPPLCLAANADLQRLESKWLPRTPAGHLTLLCRTDTRYGELYWVNDRGGMVPLIDVCRYFARVSHRDVDFVSYPVPVTCADSST